MCIYTYVCERERLGHFAVQQKLSEHYKSTKKKFFNKKIQKKKTLQKRKKNPNSSRLGSNLSLSRWCPICAQCTLGQLSSGKPGITIHDITQPWDKRAIGIHSDKRRDCSWTRGSPGEVLHTTKSLYKISPGPLKMSKNTAVALQGLCTSLDSLANVVLDNRLALDYLLAEQGGVCAIINKTCYTYVGNSGQLK